MKLMLLFAFFAGIFLVIAIAGLGGVLFDGGFVADCELPLVDAVCPLSLWITSRPGALALNLASGIVASLLAVAWLIALIWVITREIQKEDQRR